MTTYTVGLTEAKAKLSQIATRVNETGVPVTVFKHNKPWVIISPAAGTAGGHDGFDGGDFLPLENSPLAVRSDEEFWSRIAEAEADVEAGRLVDGDEMISSLRKKYGLAAL